MDYVSRMFLRIYAKNLNRSWRNSRASARIDATVSTEAVLVPPLGLALLLVYGGLRALFPDLIGRLTNRVLQVIGLAAVMGFWLWIDSRLGRVEDSATLVRQLDAIGDRRKILWFYLCGFASIVLIAVLSGYIGPVR